MNVTDKWMLEQMQQMAASMSAALPQTGQNSEPPKTEKGETFQDLMNKAKDQKADAPKKEAAADEKKAEPVRQKETAQKAEPRKVEVTKNADGTETKKVALTAEEAAMVLAGYAKLSPPAEDGTVMLVTAQDEDGNLVLPLAALESTKNSPFGAEQLVNADNGLVVEPTQELVSALEQLLEKTNDPRPVEDVLGNLTQKAESPLPLTAEPKMELVIKTPGMEEHTEMEQKTGIEQNTGMEQNAGMDQTGDEDDADLDARVMTNSQPLFHDVKAAPVKVGENFQVDTQAPDMEQKLADTIRYAAQEGLRQIEIKLSPENLGELTIKLTQSSDGTLQVVLHASNPKAENLLSQHLDNLNAALQGYSQNEVRVEVQRNDNSQQADQQQQQTDPDGHNRQQQQQQERRHDEPHSGDFIQKLRLGLFSTDED